MNNNSKYVPQEPPNFGLPSAPAAVAPPPENYPPPAVNYPPPAVNYARPTENYGPPIGNYPPPPENYAPPPGNYPPPNYTQQAYPQHTGYPPQLHPAALHAQQVYVQPPYPTQNYQLPIPGAAPPQHGPPPPPQYYGPPPPPAEQPLHIALERPTNWYYRMRLNRPQMNVLTAATVIFITGGMNIAWSAGFRSRGYYRLTQHTRVAWFIGAIIGAAIASFLPKILPKRVITIVSSALVLIGGIVNVSSHYDLDALTAGLYLNGIANGLLFAPTLALAGEQAAFYMRGKSTASTEQLSFNFGILLQILLCDTWEPSYNHSDGFNPEKVHGIINCVFGFLGLCFAALLFIESPVNLLVAGREMAAHDAVRRLQKDFPPHSDLQQMQEHKLYVSQNDSLTTEQSFVQASPIFLKLSILRALNAISISTFIFDVVYISDGKYYIIFGACRLVGSFFSSIFVDSLGRKGLTLVGLLIGGGFAFGTASQMFYPYFNVFMLLCFFQFFCGVAFTPSSAYLSEAYPLKVKQNFISFTFMIELLVFIIISTCVSYQKDVLWIMLHATGGIFSVAFLLGIWCLPETRRTTLREALQRIQSTCF